MDIISFAIIHNIPVLLCYYVIYIHRSFCSNNKNWSWLGRDPGEAEHAQHCSRGETSVTLWRMWFPPHRFLLFHNKKLICTRLNLFPRGCWRNDKNSNMLLSQSSTGKSWHKIGDQDHWPYVMAETQVIYRSSSANVISFSSRVKAGTNVTPHLQPHFSICSATMMKRYQESSYTYCLHFVQRQKEMETKNIYIKFDIFCECSFLLFTNLCKYSLHITYISLLSHIIQGHFIMQTEGAGYWTTNLLV